MHATGNGKSTWLATCNMLLIFLQLRTSYDIAGMPDELTLSLWQVETRCPFCPRIELGSSAKRYLVKLVSTGIRAV